MKVYNVKKECAIKCEHFYFISAAEPVKKATMAQECGMDVNMADIALAMSSAASKVYQKQCSHIYNEFLENMKMYLRQENELKECLKQLQKEKIQNMKYSLYRSCGADLFAASKRKRQKMIENLAIVSPLLFDDTRVNTPWGLDPIMDEDEDAIRPQTAPSTKVKDTSLESLDNKTANGRPKTVSVIKSMSIENDTDVEKQNTNDFTKMEVKMTFSSKEQSGPRINVSPPTSRPYDRVRFKIEPPSPALPTAPPYPVPSMDLRPPTPPSDDENYDPLEGADGEVDLHTERTRARKITIKPEVFVKLTNGPVMAKLIPKDGVFLIKPVEIKYTPSDVDAVFMAKDPTKEKMALVRQRTNCKSATVASDLKINNRIAIMKSLMGKESKKTSVSEIFDKANDRKTKHFRIIKKGGAVDTGQTRRFSSLVTKHMSTLRRESMNAMKDASKRCSSSPPARPPSTPLPPRASIALNLMSSTINRAKSARNPYDDIYDENMPSQGANNGIRPRTSSNGSRTGSSFGNRLGVDPTANGDLRLLRGRQTPSNGNGNNHQDLGDSMSRVTLSRLQGAATPLGDMRIPSRNMNTNGQIREGFEFKGTDVDMTQMIHNLVEGRNGDLPPEMYNRPSSNMSMASKTSTMRRMPKRMFTPTSNMSDSMSEISFGLPTKRQINHKDTLAIIKQQKQKDQEYQQNMADMRKRLAGTSKLTQRRNSKH